MWISKQKFQALENRVSELEKVERRKKSLEELINIVKEEFHTKPGTYTFCAKIRNHTIFDQVLEKK